MNEEVINNSIQKRGGDRRSTLGLATFENEINQKKREKEKTLQKIQYNEEKNLKEGVSKLVSVMALIIQKKIKIVNIIISFLILLNIIFGFISHNYYILKDEKCSNITSINEIENFISSGRGDSKKIIFNCLTNTFTRGYGNNSEIIEKTNSIKYPYYRINCEKNCDLKIIYKDAFSSNNLVTSLRWICVIFIIGIEILLYYKYSLEIDVMKTFNIACEEDSIFTTGLWKYLLLEIILLGIFSPPNYDKIISGKMLNGSFTYSIDSLIMLLYIIKIYYILKVIASFTIWSSDQVSQIGIKHKLNIGTSFILKAQFKYSSYLFMLISFISLIGIFGFLLRTFEYGFEPNENFQYNGNAITNPNFEDYTDTFWVIIITMMTVGYGDIYPSTHFGRIVVFISALFGTILTSLLIAAMGSFVTFSPKEKKVHNIIDKNNKIKESEKFAVFLIKKILLLAKIKKGSKIYFDKEFNNKNEINNIFHNKKFTLRDYLNCLISVKAAAVKFYRLSKIAKTNTIHSDELLSELDKKFNKDSENLAPIVDDIRYINKLTNNIKISEKEINKCLINLKKEQDEIGKYLIQYNNFHYDLFNQNHLNNKFGNNEGEKKKKVAFYGV